MELNIHRPLASCSRTGRAFVAGETFYSALVRSPGGLERVDCCTEAWQGPPPQAIAWWRSVHPAAEPAGSTLAPPEVLLDVLERLDGSPEDEPLRYLLALQLVRRRVLRIVERPVDEPMGDDLLLACRRRDTEYRIRVVAADAATASGIEERLSALLWSGDAA